MRQRSEDKYGQLLMVPEIRFARAAAFRLLEPSPPLITVHGPAGSGKTHLARLVIRELTKTQPEWKLSHITADNFCAGLARAAKAKSVPEFQGSYRVLDVFVCEDLQALQGRRKTQEQLSAIIDHLSTQGGRILLTSSKAPGELNRFSSKLRSRCQGGVCAAIERLGQSSRKKLLRHFAADQGFVLADDVADLLAASLTVSPRELSGIVRQLKLLAGQRRSVIDCALAEEVIREAVVTSKPTLNQITKTIAKAFSVSAADLKSDGRLQGLVLPRQLAMFAAKEWAGQAYSEIGKYFGRRSHSTIVHACQRVRTRIQTDPDFQRTVETIQEQLKIPPQTGSPCSTTR